MKDRKQTDPFYGTAAWKRVQRKALDRDIWCVRCRAAGRFIYDKHGRRVPVRATMVHHKKPMKEFPELALSLDNLESLCDRCHYEEHPEKFMGVGAKTRDPIPEIAKGIKIEVL